MLYYSYSDYLKEKFGEKVYKLPINLPVTCPNRMQGPGCAFCAGVGTGFEAMDSGDSVTHQLTVTQELIERKYHAHKFIAYFQNYTNTFIKIQSFKSYLWEAANYPGIVEISISTRPDCLTTEYLDVMQDIHEKTGIEMNIELGLQTANYHTLEFIDRGHGVAEFIDAVLMIKDYPDFTTCAHVILNLPGDDLLDVKETARILSALNVNIVKLHSLYIPYNTKLYELYENKEISICTKEEYYERVVTFLEQIPQSMVIERLFSRIPEKDAAFSNWGTSWWKMKDELMEKMEREHRYQGKEFHYLNGAALRRLN